MLFRLQLGPLACALASVGLTWLALRSLGDGADFTALLRFVQAGLCMLGAKIWLGRMEGRVP